MANPHEFFFDGLPVGYFEGGWPVSPGHHRYMPYRGVGHWKMQTLLRSGGNPRCHYDTEAFRVSFTVRACPEHGVLDLCGFERRQIAARRGAHEVLT